MRLPQTVIEFPQLAKQYGWVNPVILCGFSRGAVWVNDLVLECADLFGAAVGLAGFPWAKGQAANSHAARQAMQVRKPILYAFWAADEW